jgi:predicted nucleic acid-binding protein
LKFYLDSSFIIELVHGQPIATAIISQLDGDLFTSKLGRIETIRTIIKRDVSWLDDALSTLKSISLIALDDEVLKLVESYGSEITLKTSDAIHVASAQILLGENDWLVTLDRQMAANAKRLGLQVITS